MIPNHIFVAEYISESATINSASMTTLRLIAARPETASAPHRPLARPLNPQKSTFSAQRRSQSTQKKVFTSQTLAPVQSQYASTPPITRRLEKS